MARILLAEDDAVQRTALAAVLAEAGHEVCTAADGEEAQRRLAAFTPDLLITDVFMPRSDGLEVIRRLRAARPHTPIIAMSGGGRSGMLEALDYATLLGADQVLAKPFAPETLQAAVDDLLQDRRQAA